MATTPYIPNLLSLRSGSRGRGSRNGSPRGSTSTSTGPGPGNSRDMDIQGTDSDAAVSRLSAVLTGYLHDPFAQYFVQQSPGFTARRLPIINRGTYARTTALDDLVDRFLGGESPVPRQIVSLGSGTDTRSLRIFSRPDLRVPVLYHEIDFPDICARKLRTVQAVPALRGIIHEPAPLGDGTWSGDCGGGSRYWCHGMDLRSLSDAEASSVAAAAVLPGLEPNVPTLLISECCLCYMRPEEATRAVRWFTARIEAVALVVYEPIRPDDAFGRVMVSNLAARRIRMPTLDAYRQPADQEARLRTLGFAHTRHATIEAVWDEWTAADEKRRADMLEGLDEVEEWKLLASHYIVAWGWRDADFFRWELARDEEGGGSHGNGDTTPTR